MTRVFISHSSRDTTDALALDEALRQPPGLDNAASRLDTWLDRWDIALAGYYPSEIVSGQKDSQVAVFLLSEAALESAEVQAEWELAKRLGLLRLPFMPDRDARLARPLPEAWQYHFLDIQVWPWEGPAKAAADIYLALGLPAPHCPCGRPVPYDRCHARRQQVALPGVVSFEQLMFGRRTGVAPMGVIEGGRPLEFDPTLDRHLHCVGDRGSGKTNLAALLLHSAARRLPLYDRFVISADVDVRLTSLNLTASAHSPSGYPRVLERVAACVEDRPCLLVIDDLQALPLYVLEPLTGSLDNQHLHLALISDLGYSSEPNSVVGRALSSAGFRVHLQDGVFEFGRASASPSPTGRSTVWSSAWPGPQSAQLAQAEETR